MVYIGRCIPCQYGQHSEHHDVIEAVPEGVMGGAICDCKGTCVDEYVPPPTITVEPDPEAEAASREMFDFLERVSRNQGGAA